MDSKIKSVHGREILDSRGNPTIEVDVTLNCGAIGRAAVPSGASTGKHEAVELRDADSTRYLRKGVLAAVNNINITLATALIGKDAADQSGIDKLMIDRDGTSNKSNLGANAILGVSMAVARAAAGSLGIPLYKHLSSSSKALMPVPMFNIINGGLHAQWQGSDFQEYMIAPFGAPSFSEALRWGSEIYHTLMGILKDSGQNIGVGDEGGFIPRVSSNHKPIEYITTSIEKAGYAPGKDVGIAIDAAASGFYEDGHYLLKTEGRRLSSTEMILEYEKIISKYPIILLEDGLAEDDWDGWQLLTKKLGNKIEIVGDDLFVTNIDRIKKGIDCRAANSVLIKLNQIGTVSETIAAIKLAHLNKWGAMVSHRSGETVDSFIADLTVALETGHLKSGAPCRGERVEKYNQLLRIEEELSGPAIYAGRNAFVR
ncbi:MAG: phosphopyruvate hydratase [Dehalococcoidia bacterium]